ncbi:hypothetical protein [Amycolatopsis sp. NPDC003731]
MGDHPAARPGAAFPDAGTLAGLPDEEIAAAAVARAPARSG